MKIPLDTFEPHSQEETPPPEKATMRNGGPEGMEQFLGQEWKAGKHRAIDDLMSEVMAGRAPRGRELLPWEPDRIDERHLQIIMLRSCGMDQGRIAQITGFTEPWVSIILNHPDAQYVLARMVSYSADNVLDMQTRIQAVAHEAFDTVVDVMRTSRDEKLRSRNAFEILAMAGYGPTQRISATVEHSVAAPNEKIDALTRAIEESKQVAVIDYRGVGQGGESNHYPSWGGESNRNSETASLGSGNGSPGSANDRLSDSGHSSATEPPLDRKSVV